MKLAVLVLVALSSFLVAAHEDTFLWKFFHSKLDLIEHDDLVTLREFQQFLYNMDPPEEGEVDKLPDAAGAWKLFHHLDVNADERVSWSEFRESLHEIASFSDRATDSNSPQEVHLALTGTVGEMLVSWAQPLMLGVPTVQYGTSPAAYSFTAMGACHNYSLDSGVWQSMQLCQVKLTNLSPFATYYYRAGYDGEWGNQSSFVAAPEQVPDKVSWALYGDMGVIPFGYEVTKMLLQEHAANPFHLITHVGDIAYAGVNSHGEWEPTWDSYMNQIAPLASQLPYQVVVGNHENYYNFAAFINRFSMPGNQQPGANGNFWYSFDYGNVHVLAFSTETDESPGTEMYAFIEKDLAAAAARSDIHWIIVGGHRPLLSSDASEYADHAPAPTNHRLTNLQPLFLKYRVDLVLTGHMHCYERTYPVIVNGNTTQVLATPGQNSYHWSSLTPPAPIYVVQGNAGALVLETWVDPQPAWSANRQQVYGFGRMDVYTNSTGSYIHYQSKSSGQTIDEFMIYKSL